MSGIMPDRGPAMTVHLHASWTARRSGGLFLGVRVSFPRTEYLVDTWEYLTVWGVSIGFLFITLRIEFRHPKKVVDTSSTVT
jgi:hypothetical protein